MAYIQEKHPIKVTGCGRRRSKVAGNSPFMKFKPHNMYKTERAKTKADHNRLKEKGYDHDPYN
tara:strand:- start:100 stop:288 length:189 start_codon:yes stop_codon:yes gene_type:complete